MKEWRVVLCIELSTFGRSTMCRIWLGKLQFPKTLNHSLSNWKTNSFSRITFNFMLTAEYRILLEMFRYLLLKKFNDLRKLMLVTKSHKTTLLCVMSFPSPQHWRISSVQRENCPQGHIQGSCLAQVLQQLPRNYDKLHAYISFSLNETLIKQFNSSFYHLPLVTYNKETTQEKCTKYLYYNGQITISMDYTIWEIQQI